MSGVCRHEIVHEAFRAVLAGQEEARLRPSEFTAAWRARVHAMLAQQEIDHAPVWRHFEVSSARRARVIAAAKAGPVLEKALNGNRVQALGFSIVSEAIELGALSYGVCGGCRMGLLYRIELRREWRYCGLGTLALDNLQSRHPGVTWFTSGQFDWARGFYDRYRARSDSPWTENQRPCPHFVWWLAQPAPQEPVSASR